MFQQIGEFIYNADFGTGGLKNAILKWLKVFLWVGISAMVNFAFQKVTGVHFTDIHALGYTITAEQLNFAMTAFLNGTGAGFVRWVSTKTDQAEENLKQ